jgi:Zn-dependent peptidase ImmA (M78 family)
MTMARPRYALAKQLAEELLQRAGVTEPPVDPEALAAGLGIEVIMNTESFAHDTSVSGVLIRQNGTAVIGVNADQSKQRQTFTIAHELGHFILHGDAVHEDRGYMFRDTDSSTAEHVPEVEANQFAQNLLMPLWMVEKDVKKRGGEVELEYLAVEMADEYGVSLQAMTLRLAKLAKWGL